MNPVSARRKYIRHWSWLIQLVLLLVLLTPAFVSAGSLIVTVRDDVSGQPLDNVRVSIRQSAIHLSSDRAGKVIVNDLPPGSYDVVAGTEGYLLREITVVVQSTGKTMQEIRLQPDFALEDVITVLPEAREPAAMRALSAVSVAHLAGAGEDFFKAIQASPGVLAASEADSRLYIRGSPPSENLILLDGVPIYDPYRLFGLVTLFDPQTVSYFTIWPGGFPARFGNRLSAVVEVYNRYGTTEDWLSMSLNTSFTNTSLMLEGRLPVESGRGSWMLTGRRTYYDILLNAMNTGPSRFPYFYDLQARFFYQPTDRHELSLFAITSTEGTDISEEFDSEFSTANVDLVDDQVSHIYGLKHLMHVTPAFMLASTISFTASEQKSHASVIVGEEAFRTSLEIELDTREYMLQEHIEFAMTPNHTLETGFFFSRSPATSLIGISSDDPAITIPPELAHFQTDSQNVKLGWFFQDTFFLSERLETTAGFRYDEESLSGFSRWSPRLNVSWKLTEYTEIHAASGLYYHFPSYETLQSEGLLFNLEEIEQLGLRPERAVHYVLGIAGTRHGQWHWSLDMYHKELLDLIVGQKEYFDLLVLDDNGNTSVQSVETIGISPVNEENGYARGLEILLQRDNLLDRLSLQLAYTLAETRARREGNAWHYRSYDQRHSLNVTGEWTLTESWRLNAVWRLGSGFPYTPPGEIYAVVEDTNGNGLYDPEEGERLSYLQITDPDHINGQRYPFYHRLDARLSYSMKLTNISATFYLDVLNLYNQKNVQGYEYSRDYSERKAVEGLPFLPTFGIHIYF